MTNATVLIVEDEPLIRMGMVELIEEAGLAAIEASSASEALTILEGNGTVSTVVTDVVMPGKIDGLMLAAIIREAWPATRVIVTSGYIPPGSRSIPEGAAFLAKPFRSEALLEAIAA